MRKSKMRKAMLVVGMATALNLGMGLDNEGWSMMNEEGENYKTVISNVSVKIYDGSILKEDLLSLSDLIEDKKNIKYAYKADLDQLLRSCIFTIKSKDYNCSSISAEKYLKSLNVIKSIAHDLSENYRNFLSKICSDIRRELTY